MFCFKYYLLSFFSSLILSCFGGFLFFSNNSFSQEISKPDYVIVVSQKTMDHLEWQKTVNELQRKYDAEILIWQNDLSSIKQGLQRIFPRYVCFVAQPEETGRDFIASLYDLTVSLDDDPYIDVLWAVLTGYDAENALSIAQRSEPLTIRKVAGGTEFAIEMVDEGQWFDELKKNKHVVKRLGERPVEQLGPDETTEALVSLLNDYQPDLWITSGHATEHDWLPGYSFPNGRFFHRKGKLGGETLNGKIIWVRSVNPKVYMPIGNCLAGHINGQDCMATSYMKSAGVCQMCGYTVPTWFGYAGWGCLDYFLEQPGRFTFIEACLANQQALRFEKIETLSGRGKILLAGLNADEKVLALYGDPAWSAKMAPQPTAWDQNLVQTEKGFIFEITPNRGKESFEPINQNGSQRGGRPIIQWLPFRVENIEIVAGEELNPVIMDNFILIPHSSCSDKTKPFKIEFRCQKIK